MTDPAPGLWDFAGPDGLAFARVLFSEEVSQLAAYQSLETRWQGASCSLLRLCENNYRVGIHSAEEAPAEALRAAAAGRRVWVKPSRLATLRLGEEALASLLPVTTVKPPHRLAGLGQNRAVPARIAGRAALVWRHPVGGVPTVEIQAALGDMGAISVAISDSISV